MDNRRGLSGKDYTNVYSPDEIRAVLNSIGIQVRSESENDFLCLCPFHGNSRTPSMTVSRISGLFNCFNPSCAEAGNLKRLVAFRTEKSEFEILRFIASHRTGTADFEKIMSELGKEPSPEELVEFPADKIVALKQAFWRSQEAQDYMAGRGFNPFVLEEFRVGFSDKQSMVTIPAYTETGMPVGIVGRSISGKDFKNSNGLPRNQFVFNAQTAKRGGGTVIITESCFDVIKLAQCGYKNGVALLGGVLGKNQVRILDRLFDKIIIATDFDDRSKHLFPKCKKCAGTCQGHNPGRDLGIKIATALSHKEVSWACYDMTTVYPGGAKDLTDLSDKDVQTVVQKALPHFEYQILGLY